MRKLGQEQNLRRDKVSGLAVVFLLVLAVVLSGVRVFAANRMVETSERMRQLDYEVARLEEENQTLSEELRKFTASSYIERQIEALGFEAVRRYSYVAAPGVVAVRGGSSYEL